MKSQWRSGGGVSERDGRGDQPGHAGAHTLPEVARMTAVDVLERVDELANGRADRWTPPPGRLSVHIGNPG